MSKDKFFLILLLLCIPFQLNKFFPVDFDIVSGIRLDLLTPVIYLSDIFLIMTIIFWLFRKSKGQFLKINKKTVALLVFALIFCAVNLSVAKIPQLVIFKIIKLAELVLLFTYIISEKIPSRLIIRCLIIGAIISACLSIGQFLKQASIGGIFYWFGERYFNLQTPGIAKAVIFGKLVLRPYGAFPHPNVLAGFLSLVLLSSMVFLKKKPIPIILFQLFLLVVLLLTMSRITIIAYLFSQFGLLIYWTRIKHIKLNLLLTCLLITVFVLVIFKELTIGRFGSLGSASEQTISLRNELFNEAQKTFLEHFWLGVGLNNSLLYSRYLQPVHNTFLLIAVESGVTGLLYLLFILLRSGINLFRQRSPIGVLFSVIFIHLLVLAFFDHYFYTLHQGQLLFTVFMSLSFRKNI